MSNLERLANWVSNFKKIPIYRVKITYISIQNYKNAFSSTQRFSTTKDGQLRLFASEMCRTPLFLLRFFGLPFTGGKSAEASDLDGSKVPSLKHIVTTIFIRCGHSTKNLLLNKFPI